MLCLNLWATLWISIYCTNENENQYWVETLQVAKFCPQFNESAYQMAWFSLSRREFFQYRATNLFLAAKLNCVMFFNPSRSRNETWDIEKLSLSKTLCLSLISGMKQAYYMIDMFLIDYSLQNT